MLAVVALLTVALLGVSTDAPAGGGERAPRWFGIAFDRAVVSYRPLLGDPLQVMSAPALLKPGGTARDVIVPPERHARFWFAGAPHVFLIVSERQGAVTGLNAFVDASPSAAIGAVEADPSGIRLGSTLQEVAASRPAAWRYVAQGDVHLAEIVDQARGIAADYRFADGRLIADHWFTWAGNDRPQLPGATPYAEPAGESELTAILDAQANERDGAAWEYLFVRYHPCDGTTAWRLGTKVVRRANGRVYDVLEASCPTTGAKRTFFFEVTPFYGKF